MRQFNIYSKFNGLLFGGAIVSAIAVAVVTVSLSNQFVEQALNDEARSAERAFMGEIAASQRAAEMMAVLVSEMPLAGKAMADNDRATLETQFLPGFTRLMDAYDVRQFQFHTPPATSFFRVHKPEKFGDDLSSFRNTVLVANRDKSVISGLEGGVAGIGIRGMAPVSYKGAHLGTVEFGLSLHEGFVKKFTEKNGYQTAIFVKGNDGFSLIGSTFTSDIDPANFDFEDRMRTPAFWQTLPGGNSNLAGIAFPVVDFSGNSIGVGVIAIDRTHYNGIATYGRWAAAAVAGLMLLIAALISVTGRHLIFRPINALTKSMDRLAAGELDVKPVFVERTDEVGAMARTVEVFRENAIKVGNLSEQEAARIERSHLEHAEMMQELQRSFGAVVDAAIAGDFSKRVEAEFSDMELNALARSVNDLVETVDRGLKETGTVLSSLAETDLRRRVTGTYKGAFDKLKRDTNALAERLVEIVTQLRNTSRGVKTATGEILTGANDLSQRTTKQAATIEETSAAMEQLAHTVMDNAKRAGEASTEAGKASHTAEEGGKVMAEANEAMERISASSAKISNIIGMIDDIAFQTNLLALNASVEAARAGEAGKGFAVVAVEVRRLAQSSAEASSDVKALIEQSAVEVSGGTKLVASATEKLSAILEAVKTNAKQMEEIARESREQASSIDEVNTAVRQMDEMTQHNAALVEETNAAIEQTEAQASELDRIVEVFTLDEEAPARTETPAPPRPMGGKAQKEKATKAAAPYLTKGNAAIDKDWNEF